MEEITIKETMTWIGHAIAYFNNKEKYQKDIAKILDIEESRLSEMKRGTRKMPSSLMEKIVDACGAPRRGVGRFEFVEMYGSLYEFFEKFDDVTDNHFFRRLSEALSRNDYINFLIKGYNLKPDTIENITEVEQREFIINRVNKLLRSPKFNKLCSSYQESLISSQSRDFNWMNNDLNEYFEMNDIIIKDGASFHCLYLQWLLLNHAEYEFGNKSTVNIAPLIDSSPVVITGARILNISNDRICKAPININVTKRFGSVNGYPEISTGDISRYHGRCPSQDLLTYPMDTNMISVKPDLWEKVQCELYLGEAMNYHLLINLTRYNYSEVGKYNRMILIHNINPLSLLNCIEEMRKWCGLPLDNHYQLKQAIARAGGYVPGAKVLI